MAGAEFLTLGEAAALLSVHPATLRRWADQGDILVMVTPGGHRRFPRSEIERLKGIGPHAEDESSVAAHLVERALAAARAHLPEQAGAGWVAGFREDERQEKRESGLRLMSLLQRFLSAADDDQPEILEEVRAIGRAYTHDAQNHDLGPSDVFGAVAFFRDQTIDSALSEDVMADPSAARGAIQRVNAFFNAMLLSAVGVFEE